MKPKKMVYVSCEPSSLARDLKLLKSMYDIKDVVPVDMFSQTYHVETVALLSLK
jgi:23S rRNA (uracil1939-C5)-methyltransferase